MRVYDWDPIRAEHYGQRLHRSHKQAGHMTAPDQCCRCVRKYLPRRRPHMTQSGHWSDRSDAMRSHGVPPTMGPHPYPVDRLRIGRKALLGSGSLIEGNHLLHDKGQTVLHGEVAGLQAVHLRLGKILEIGLAAFRCEEDVALAPEDNGLRLMLPQERLPFGIKLNVGPVVVEEIK